MNINKFVIIILWFYLCVYFVKMKMQNIVRYFMFEIIKSGIIFLVLSSTLVYTIGMFVGESEQMSMLYLIHEYWASSTVIVCMIAFMVHIFFYENYVDDSYGESRYMEILNVREINEDEYLPITPEYIHYEYPKIDLRDCEKLTKLIDYERSKVYSENGINILKSRYLKKYGEFYENIQMFALRVALHMSNFNLKIVGEFYDVVSIGLINVSSTFYNGLLNNDDVSACKIFSENEDLLYNYSNCIDSMFNNIGVGLGLSNVFEHNGIDLYSMLSILNETFSISRPGRKSKLAVYTHLHSNNIDNILKVRSVKDGILENIYTGLFIPSYFLKCVKERKPWYFFNDEEIIKKLNSKIGDDYEQYYNLNIENAVDYIDSNTLLLMIINSLKQNGSPYIIWKDHVNKFNNFKDIESVSTLNLCSEITCCNTPRSNCILCSVNLTTYLFYPKIIQNLYNKYKSINLENMYEKNAYIGGFIATMGLNNVMKSYNVEVPRLREIGVSPFGLFDISCVETNKIKQINLEVCETLYMGCVYASSIYYNQNDLPISYKQDYANTEFAYGRFQFVQREFKPKYNWESLRVLAIEGMANVLLTTQAPTSITSQLFDTTDSIQLPIKSEFTQVNLNKKFIRNPLGFQLNNDAKIGYKYDLDLQLKLYRDAANFVDHSQSTIYFINGNDDLLKVFKTSFNYKLKTGIYYVNNAQFAKSINISNNFECDACTN